MFPNGPFDQAMRVMRGEPRIDFNRGLRAIQARNGTLPPHLQAEYAAQYGARPNPNFSRQIQAAQVQTRTVQNNQAQTEQKSTYSTENKTELSPSQKLYNDSKEMFDVYNKTQGEAKVSTELVPMQGSNGQMYNVPVYTFIKQTENGPVSYSCCTGQYQNWNSHPTITSMNSMSLKMYKSMQPSENAPAAATTI